MATATSKEPARPEMYSRVRVAGIFGVTTNTVALWQSKGKLPAPACKIGRTPFWAREVIDRLIAGESPAPAS